MLQLIPNNFAFDLNFNILEQVKLLPQLRLDDLQSIILIRFRDIDNKILLEGADLELKLKLLFRNIEDVDLKVFGRRKTLKLLLRSFV